MFKKLLLLAALLSLTPLPASEVLTRPFAAGVTNIAASTTNATAGSTLEVFDQRAMNNTFRLYAFGTGQASTTNGSMIVKFSTAGMVISGVTNYDTAANTAIKLTFSTIGNATVGISTNFDLSGVEFMRVGQVENTFLGPVSNMSFFISYTTK